MLYRFKSQATADLIMLGPQGDQLLKLIGKAPGPQGIITAAQLPAAIESLRKVVAADEARQPAPASVTASEADDAHAEDGPAVSLGQRAQPLLGMLSAALAAQQDVVWGV